MSKQRTALLERAKPLLSDDQLRAFETLIDWGIFCKKEYFALTEEEVRKLTNELLVNNLVIEDELSELGVLANLELRLDGN